MNEGDVYILDVGEILYVWNGKSSSRTERIKVRSQLRFKFTVVGNRSMFMALVYVWSSVLRMIRLCLQLMSMF